MNESGPQSSIEERYCPSCDRSYAVPLKHCPNDGTRLVTLSSDPLLGRILDDRFRIDEKLGSGGMGTVYRGSQISIGRDVAIKVIHSRLSQRTEVVKRFLREAKLASRLNQPNTVTVLDFGQTTDGLLFLVMELLQGRTLGAVMGEEAPFATRRAARIGAQLCDALEAAHDLSIIHRDLKPSNVVVLDQPAGRDYLKVLDFGLAKSLSEDSATTITHSDAILGTPAYISPEAVLGRDTDARADLYALGIILYQMISGRLPFDATTANLMLTSHVNDPPRPLPETVDDEARALIEQLLSKRPEDRPDSAAAVRARLEPLRASRSPALPADRGAEIAVADTVGRSSEVLAEALAETTAQQRDPEPPRRSRAAAIAAMLVAVAAVAVLAVILTRGGAPASDSAAGADAAPGAAGADADVPEIASPAAIDAGIVATADAASPPILDAASPRERTDRRRTGRRRDRGDNQGKTDETDADKPPDPVWIEPDNSGVP